MVCLSDWCDEWLRQAFVGKEIPGQNSLFFALLVTAIGQFHSGPREFLSRIFSIPAIRGLNPPSF
jgi:hypothetical protein